MDKIKFIWINYVYLLIFNNFVKKNLGDIMTVPTCPICKAQDWDTGFASSGGFPSQNLDTGVYYTSFKKKKLAPQARLEADVCLRCGHVVLYVDVNNLKKSLKK